MAPTSTRNSDRQSRYQALLSERVIAGQRLYQVVSHPHDPAARAVASDLLRQALRLDRQLDRYYRYQATDFLQVVSMAEDEALHAPGADSSCPYCQQTPQTDADGHCAA